MQFLLVRIDDIALRGWIIEQIREGQINRLAIHVHSDLHDDAIIASWQTELDAENAAANEAVNNTATQAELIRKLTELTATNPPAKSQTKV